MANSKLVFHRDSPLLLLLCYLKFSRFVHGNFPLYREVIEMTVAIYFHTYFEIISSNHLSIIYENL